MLSGPPTFSMMSDAIAVYFDIMFSFLFHLMDETVTVVNRHVIHKIIIARGNAPYFTAAVPNLVAAVVCPLAMSNRANFSLLFVKTTIVVFIKPAAST